MAVCPISLFWYFCGLVMVGWSSVWNFFTEACSQCLVSISYNCCSIPLLVLHSSLQFYLCVSFLGEVIKMCFRVPLIMSHHLEEKNVSTHHLQKVKKPDYCQIWWQHSISPEYLYFSIQCHSIAYCEFSNVKKPTWTWLPVCDKIPVQKNQVQQQSVQSHEMLMLCFLQKAIQCVDVTKVNCTHSFVCLKKLVSLQTETIINISQELAASNVFTVYEYNSMWTV